MKSSLYWKQCVILKRLLKFWKSAGQNRECQLPGPVSNNPQIYTWDLQYPEVGSLVIIPAAKAHSLPRSFSRFPGASNRFTVVFVEPALSTWLLKAEVNHYLDFLALCIESQCIYYSVHAWKHHVTSHLVTKQPSKQCKCSVPIIHELSAKSLCSKLGFIVHSSVQNGKTRHQNTPRMVYKLLWTGVLECLVINEPLL